jgi:hypothetical protein
VPVERQNTFSFIDRITSIDNAGLIRGHFTIPLSLDSFPQCLVAEAVGQLAAWYAMHSQAFAYRPVASLAGATLFHGEAIPGERIDLLVQIENCDADTVSYSGLARCGQRLIMELKDCTGIMLPQIEFADPTSVEQHYRQLVTVGVNNNRVDVAADLLPTDLCRDNLHRIRGRLNVPLDAEFFSDHFPNKPVFPATLLMQAFSTMLVEQLRDTYDRYSAKLLSAEEIKFRAWIYPGDQLELVAEGLANGSSPGLFKINTYRSGRTVAIAKIRLDYNKTSKAP